METFPLPRLSCTNIHQFSSTTEKSILGISYVYKNALPELLLPQDTAQQEFFFILFFGRSLVVLCVRENVGEKMVWFAMGV